MECAYISTFLINTFLLFIDLNTPLCNVIFLKSFFFSLTPYWCTWSYWITHTHTHTHTHAHTHILGRTPLDERSVHRRHLYVYNIHKRQRAMPPSGVEHWIWASDMSQTYALDRAVTGIGAWDTVRRNKVRTLGVERWKTKWLDKKEWLGTAGATNSWIFL